jgi:hypothetical protein
LHGLTACVQVVQLEVKVEESSLTDLAESLRGRGRAQCGCVRHDIAFLMRWGYHYRLSSSCEKESPRWALLPLTTFYEF